MESKKEIKVKLSVRNAFYFWVDSINPLLKLAHDDKKLFAELLYQRYIIHQEILADAKLNNTTPDTSNANLDLLLFKPKPKKEIMARISMKEHTVNNLLTRLRKAKIVKGRSLDARFMPGIVPLSTNNVKLVYSIDLTDVLK